MGFQCVLFSVLLTLSVLFIIISLLCDVDDLVSLFYQAVDRADYLLKHFGVDKLWKKKRK